MDELDKLDVLNLICLGRDYQRQRQRQRSLDVALGRDHRGSVLCRVE